MAPEPMTSKAIRDAVRGNNTAKDQAVQVLVAEGYVERTEDGARILHRLVTPYREDEK